jgi:hypothetical protein
MNGGRLALLLGLFALPLLALWLGHRLQRRSPRARGAFWGLVVGHTAGALAFTLAAMLPPEFWRPTDLGRLALTFWSMLAVGLVGMGIGAALGGGRKG